MRQLLAHAGESALPQQPRRNASHGVADSEAGFDTPSRADGASCADVGISSSEKQTLDVVTDHPMIPLDHLALWLGVGEGGRVSQMMHSLESSH